MAYVRKVGSRWKCEIRVKVGDALHEENATFDTKAEAEDYGRDRERELRGRVPRKTVRDLLERFRQEVSETRDGGRWEINRLLAIERRWGERDRWGGSKLVDLPLADFGNAQMAAIRRDRLASIAPASVAREEALLKAVWARARHPEWGWTDVDPFKDLGPIRGSKGRARRRKAVWSEVRRLLRQAGYHPRRPETTKTAEVGLALLVALRTTLRSQEVLQLGDDCVDLERLVISIERHKTRYVTHEPKRVPILPKALVLLGRKCLGRGRYFSVSPASRDSIYRKVKNLAGVPDLTFHDFKRTAVLMLKERLSEDELMAVTGNADVQVLRRHYMTDTAAEAAKAVWRALGASPSKVIDVVRARTEAA